MPTDIMGEPDADTARRIYIVRHGTTGMNTANVMRGWDNPDLNAEGVKDAETLAQALKDTPLSQVYCSTLKRAVHTMEIIVKSQATPLKITLTDNLKTIDVGAWTGEPVSSVEPALAKLQVKWRTDPDLFCPHGESWTQFQGRQLKAWKQILAASGDTLVVSHLRCSVWAMGYALNDGKPLSGDTLSLLDRITQAPARVTTFTYSKAEGLKILGVNAQEPEPVEPPSKP